VYPYPVNVFGLSISIWNAAFALGVVIGFPLFHRAFSSDSTKFLWARYVVAVYLSAIAAKYFAYLFDANGTFRAPPGTTYVDWLLNPVAGPKTLYGVIVLMPITMRIALVGSGMNLRRALNLATPAMVAVLAAARVGCFLQGCCFGMHSTLFGLSFPPGSPAQAEQVTAGLVSIASMSVPVIPTQLIEAGFLACLAAWSWYRHHQGAVDAFVVAVCSYSVLRFLVEFVRADVDRGIYGPFAASQWIAIAVLTSALIASRRATAEAAKA
jgi:phosphatidylglycerol:prolipoprotein diacylglycerol transferase